jgi:hypothetical protein
MKRRKRVCSLATSPKDGKNNAFDTYIVVHHIPTCNNGGSPIVESTRHLSIVVDIAGGHTEQDVHGYQIQLVKDRKKPRYLIVLQQRIENIRQKYNKVSNVCTICKLTLMQKIDPKRTLSN